ncbi:MAG: signal peptidase I [Clostridiales bacterium]|jgi:signal peptidase I|nr:signal peptidase I [Clostridiales bacterium]
MNEYFESDQSKFNKKLLIEILIFLLQIGAVVFLAYLTVNYGIERTTVYEDSMNPTLVEDDSIIIDKFTYRLSDPKRFDVIVFLKTDKEHSYYNIKRIIGLPGETVQIKSDGIYINDKKIEEDIEVEDMDNFGLASEPILLDENEYFVLGDNRNKSEDSRFANVGNIIRDNILGKAWIRTNDFNFVSKLNLKKN